MDYHLLLQNPLSNGNCATPITPGGSQVISGPMSVHQQQQQPVNRPPSNSMQQQLARAPSAPNVNAFPQQAPSNQMPMAQVHFGPILFSQLFVDLERSKHDSPTKRSNAPDDPPTTATAAAAGYDPRTARHATRV